MTIHQLSEVKIKDFPDNKTFEIIANGPKADVGRIKVVARKEDIKNIWLDEIKKYVVSTLDKGEVEENETNKGNEELEEEHAQLRTEESKFETKGKVNFRFWGENAPINAW